MNAPDQTDPSGRGVDGRYLTVVALLLVVIVACLGVLWLSERSRRIAADVRAAELMRENVNLQAVVQQMMLARPGGLVELPLDREAATQPATAPAAPAAPGR